MSRSSILMAAGILGLSLAWAAPVRCQVGPGRSYDSPPAFSPWFNLYQKQGGPLDTYHMFVQPEVQLRNTLQWQQAGIQRNYASFNYVMSQAEVANAPPQPTGAGSTFMNHGNFFNTYRTTAGGTTGTMYPGSAAATRFTAVQSTSYAPSSTDAANALKGPGLSTPTIGGSMPGGTGRTP